LLKNGRIKNYRGEGKSDSTDCRADDYPCPNKAGLHARRQALAYLYDETVVKDLFEKIGPKCEVRNGGYTRIIPFRAAPW